MNNLENEKKNSCKEFFEAIKSGKINDLKKIIRDPENKPWEYFEDNDYSGINKIEFA